MQSSGPGPATLVGRWRLPCCMCQEAVHKIQHSRCGRSAWLQHMPFDIVQQVLQAVPSVSLCKCAQGGADAVKAIPEWRGGPGGQPVQQNPDQNLMRQGALQHLTSFGPMYMSRQAASCVCIAASQAWEITMVQLADQQNTAAMAKSSLLTEAVVTKMNKCSKLDELECCALFGVIQKLSLCCSVTHLSLSPFAFSQKVLQCAPGALHDPLVL